MTVSSCKRGRTLTFRIIIIIITGVPRSSNYHTHAGMHHIRPLLTLDTAKMITHSVVSSRLDYSNTLLHGTSATNLNKLQVTQNTLASVMCQAPCLSTDILILCVVYCRWYFRCRLKCSVSVLLQSGTQCRIFLV